jgi:hypothetical protein
MHYSHTQKVPDNVMAVATLAGLALGLTPPGLIARLAVVGVMGAVGYQFRSLTVEVDDNELRLQFGDGPIRKTFPLSEVTGVQTTRTSPLAGWGMRWIGSGWLYNIYGLDAVELTMAGGKRVLVGTDEPEELAAAINERPVVVSNVSA